MSDKFNFEGIIILAIGLTDVDRSILIKRIFTSLEWGPVWKEVYIDGSRAVGRVSLSYIAKLSKWVRHIDDV